MKTIDIFSKDFLPYGDVISDDVISLEVKQKLIDMMNTETVIPERGNVYVADYEPVSTLGVRGLFEGLVDGQKLQFGYCHGQNLKVNALEWHEGREIILAVTDCVLFLGLPSQLDQAQGGYEFNTKNLIAVELKEGELIQLHNRVLHFAPVKVKDDGFRTMIILPKGTNTPIEVQDKTDPYLFMKNKWLIAHDERPDLVEKGAKYGLIGQNYDWSELK